MAHCKGTCLLLPLHFFSSARGCLLYHLVIQQSVHPASHPASHPATLEASHLCHLAIHCLSVRLACGRARKLCTGARCVELSKSICSKFPSVKVPLSTNDKSCKEQSWMTSAQLWFLQEGMGETRTFVTQSWTPILCCLSVSMWTNLIILSSLVADSSHHVKKVLARRVSLSMLHGDVTRQVRDLKAIHVLAYYSCNCCFPSLQLHSSSLWNCEASKPCLRAQQGFQILNRGLTFVCRHR